MNWRETIFLSMLAAIAVLCALGFHGVTSRIEVLEARVAQLVARP